MTKVYDFIIGKHTEQAHDCVNTLIDEAYKRKAGDNPTTAHERVSKAEELTEAHYAQVGQKPAESVLSRLAWYIVFDEMTNNHPDKITREEYPIMNESQRKRRKEIPSKNVYFRKGDYVGARSVYEKSDKHGTGFVKKYPIYSEISDNRDTGIDVLRLLDNAGLTERQREAIELVFFEDLTQEQAGKRLGVSKQAINLYLSISYEKIRNTIDFSSVSSM